MALDPSIILQGRGVQLDNPIDTQNKLAQLYQVRNQNRLADLTFADNQRERAGENSLSQLLAEGKSGDDVVRGLASQGFGKSGLAYGKQFQERQKATADIGKVGADTDHIKAQTSETQAKVMNLAAQQHKDAIGLVNDRETAVGWLQSMYSDPRLKDIVGASGTTVEQAIARIPMDGDTAGFEKWKMQAALGGDKLIAMTTPDAKARLTAQTSRLNNKDSNAVAIRGQNMVDARQEKSRNMALTHGVKGLSEAQNEALFGEGGAVTTGKLDPNRINSRTASLFADAFIRNPSTDMSKISGDIALSRNATFRQKAMVAEALPEIMQSMVDSGKKLGFSDNRTLGKMQGWVKGEWNDPDMTEYMVQRNDALMTVAGVMRGNGMTDMAHKAETEVSAPTMNPAALDAWMRGQMKSLEPRLRINNRITRDKPVGAHGTPAPATSTVPSDIDALLKKHGGK